MSEFFFSFFSEGIPKVNIPGLAYFRIQDFNSLYQQIQRFFIHKTVIVFVIEASCQLKEFQFLNNITFSQESHINAKKVFFYRF